MKSLWFAGASLLAMAAGGPAAADERDLDRIEALEARIEQLEATNTELIALLRGPSQLPSARSAPAAAQPKAVVFTSAAEAVHTTQASPSPRQGGRSEDWRRDLVGVSPSYGFEILDHAEGVNTRELTILQAIQNGELESTVTLSGAVTVLANYQESNSNSKFSWLMRHPTSSNQIGETVSEMVVHSAQLATTARLTDDITTYLEFLYNPQQSFGSGTITDLNRNQVQVRRAFVLWGNLEERPIYAAIGKMDTPFGLHNTVSPFTNSTSWHAFAGLAYGGMVGYFDNGLHLRAMAIQGGAQFRSHNVPVEGTSVPSRLNNFAVDANYTLRLGSNAQILAGASYTHGSPYCQDYPVFHFNPCEDNNPAWAVYAQGRLGAFEFLGEYAETTEVWPGTASPAPQFAQFEAVAPFAWTLGGRYWFNYRRPDDIAISLEYSRYVSGDEGAPWERQDQWVLGGSYYLTDSVNLFGELIHARGWVPLNFLSGGNLPNGAAWSEFDAETSAVAVGVQAAF